MICALINRIMLERWRPLPSPPSVTESPMAEPDSSAKNIEIRGIVAELPDERSVFVGRVEGSESLYVKFTNKGRPTRLILSPEAFDLMVVLRGSDRAPNHTERMMGDVKLEWCL